MSSGMNCLVFLCQTWPLVLSSGGCSLPTAILASVSGYYLLAPGYHLMFVGFPNSAHTFINNSFVKFSKGMFLCSAETSME